MALTKVQVTPKINEGKTGGSKIGSLLGAGLGGAVGFALGGPAGSGLLGAVGAGLGGAAGGAGLGGLIGETVKPGQQPTVIQPMQTNQLTSNYTQSLEMNNQILHDAMQAMVQMPDHVRTEYSDPLVKAYMLNNLNGGIA